MEELKTKFAPPREGVEQATLMNWAAMREGKYPELRLLFHIPNEGKRSKSTGGRMVKEGLKKGVPDVFLPVARGDYHGLFIEMKRQKGSRVSEEQRKWMAELVGQGYATAICYGWENAAACLTSYLDGAIECAHTEWKKAELRIEN